MKYRRRVGPPVACFALSRHSKRTPFHSFCMQSVFLCLACSLLFIRCSEDDGVDVTFPKHPAELAEVRVSGSSERFSSYAPGDTINFVLTTDNHLLAVHGGKVCAGDMPVIDFTRVDSMQIDPVTLYAEFFTTPIEYVSTLSEDRRIIRCTLPTIANEDPESGGSYRWYLQLSLGNGDPLTDRSGSFTLIRK